MVSREEILEGQAIMMKLAKLLEVDKMVKIKYSVGDVFYLGIDDAYCAFGQVVSDSIFTFYDFTDHGREFSTLPLERILQCDILFSVSVHDNALS